MPEAAVQVEVAAVLLRPPDQIPAAAEDYAKQQAMLAFNDAKAKLEDEIGVPIPTSREGVEKLAKAQAEALFTRLLESQGIPEIPFEISADTLTVEGVEALAYDTGRAYLESALEDYSGFPVKLPQRFTAEGIEQWGDAMVPDDAAEAIDIAIMIGVHYLSGAITAALVGAGIGSAIPGIGTVVGIGVALGVNALRESFKEVHAYQTPCNIELNLDLPQASPIELIPWLAHRRKLTSKQVARARQFGWCEAPTYHLFLSKLMQDAEPDVLDTVQVLGLHQLQRLIPIYEEAPKGQWVHRDGGIIWENETNYGSVTRVLALMHARLQALQGLVARGDNMDAIPFGERHRFHLDLVVEVSNAAMQIVFTQSQEALKWYSQLAVYVQYSAAQRDAQYAEMKARVDAEVVQEGCSTEMRRDATGNEQFVTVCDPKVGEAARSKFCYDAYKKWRKDNPQYDGCLFRGDEKYFRLPCESWLRGEITFETGAQAWTYHVQNNGCGLRPLPSMGGPRTPWEAFTRGFVTSGFPVQRSGVADGFLTSLNPLRFLRG